MKVKRYTIIMAMLHMFGNRIILALVLMVIGSGVGRAFDVKKFLYTKEFREYMKEYKHDSIFNKCKAEYTAKYRGILTPKNISETIDYLKDIYVADKDTLYTIPKENSIVLYFLTEACGAPERFFSVEDEIINSNFFYDIWNEFIPITTGWYERNEHYISPKFIDMYCEVIAANIALQKCYCIDPKTDEEDVTGIGTSFGWSEGLWNSTFWKRFKKYPIGEFYLKLFGIRQSFTSIFYWYRLGNNLNELPPYEVITCGYEIENMPKTEFDIYPDPILLYY